MHSLFGVKDLRERKKHERVRISKGGREGGSDSSDLSFPYNCRLCVHEQDFWQLCLCASEFRSRASILRFLNPPTPPHHTWFTLTKGPNGSIFYCGFWEQAERERDSWSPSVASAPPSTHVTFTQESFNSGAQLGKSSSSLWQIAVKCNERIGLARSCACVILACLSRYTSAWQGCLRWGRP